MPSLLPAYPQNSTKSSQERDRPWLGFFTSHSIRDHAVVFKYGTVSGSSRTSLSPLMVRRLSLSSSGSDSSTGSSFSSPSSPDSGFGRCLSFDSDDEEEAEGGFFASDEALMSEAFHRAEITARAIGANALLGLKLRRKEAGSFYVSGIAIYATAIPQPNFSPAHLRRSR